MAPRRASARGTANEATDTTTNPTSTTEPSSQKRKPGRPPKPKDSSGATTKKSAPAKLGRPPGSKNVVPSATLNQGTRSRPRRVPRSARAIVAVAPVIKKKDGRGRPKGYRPSMVNAGTGTTGKRRPGRPRKGDVQAETKVYTGKKRGRPPKSAADEDEEPPKQRVRVARKAPRPRGRPSKAQGKQEEEKTGPDGISYWLMKAEPESRIEKGKDVKFSIDDLMNVTEPEPWSGVRNPVANMNLRNMKVGDLAFFYHSNVKVPGIVGIMEIVESATPDETAFDETDPYYDARSSRDKPRWVCPKVSFREKFPVGMTLEQVRAHATDINNPLNTMQLVKQNRLSVGQVTPKQWNYILPRARGEDVGDARGEANEQEGEPLQDEAAAEAAIAEQLRAEIGPAPVYPVPPIEEALANVPHA